MKDGRPYGQFKYEHIIKEAYIISKNTHNSYSDVLQMNPTERSIWKNLILDEIKASNEKLAKARAAHQKKMNNG